MLDGAWSLKGYEINQMLIHCRTGASVWEYVDMYTLNPKPEPLVMHRLLKRAYTGQTMLRHLLQLK